MINSALNLAVPVVTLATVLVAAWRAWRAEKAAAKTAEHVQRLEISVDGRLQQLLDLTRSDAHAAGMAEERAASDKDT